MLAQLVVVGAGHIAGQGEGSRSREGGLPRDGWVDSQPLGCPEPHRLEMVQQGRHLLSPFLLFEGTARLLLFDGILVVPGSPLLLGTPRGAPAVFVQQIGNALARGVIGLTVQNSLSRCRSPDSSQDGQQRLYLLRNPLAAQPSSNRVAGDRWPGCLGQDIVRRTTTQARLLERTHTPQVLEEVRRAAHFHPVCPVSGTDIAGHEKARPAISSPAAGLSNCPADSSRTPRRTDSVRT